jgi:hypothetical protein
MQENSNAGWKMLAAAAILGFLGDLLLRAVPWGINLVLWSLSFAICIALIKKSMGEVWNGEGRWLFIPALLFPLLFAWRDSPPLLTLNFLIATGVFALAILRARSGAISVMSLVEGVVAGCLFVIHLLVGFLLLLIENLHWKRLSSNRHRQISALIRGSLLAVPPLLVFGGLFIGADAAFEGIVSRMIQWFYNNIFSHIFLFGVFLWLSGGILKQLFLTKQWIPSSKEVNLPLTIGCVETSVLLGAINLLFLTFVLIQIRYFFGGANLVETSSTMTYSEYARKGFFELVLVSALVLPLLLGTHWLIRKEEGMALRIFQVLAGFLIALLYVIMVSAFQRMRLYQQEYGLTELRFYTTAFMGWLAILFVWFALTVMRGSRNRFVAGALVTLMVSITALDFANPDAWIAQHNVARIAQGKKFDASYASSLSADAVPVLLHSLNSMNPKDREMVSSTLLLHWNVATVHDWRSWNWNRYQARKRVDQHLTELWQMTGRVRPKSGESEQTR